MADRNVVQTPFFARFLETQDENIVTVPHKTLKFPSDTDEWDD